MMVSIPRELLDSASLELSAYRRAASDSVRNGLEELLSIMHDPPTEDDIKVLREEATRLIRESSLMTSDNVSAMTSDYLNAMTNGMFNAEDLNGPSFAKPESVIAISVNEYAAGLEDGSMNAKEFVNNCADRASIDVTRMHVSMLDSLTKKRKRTKWARVPMGAESCPWCIMLGSRGFDYNSASSAGAASHAYCDCMIAPSFMHGLTNVIGYDPEALYDAYLKSGFVPNTHEHKDGKGWEKRKFTLKATSIADYMEKAESIEDLESRYAEVVSRLQLKSDNDSWKDKKIQLSRTARGVALRVHKEMVRTS